MTTLNVGTDFSTIQDAIDAAATGDTILVAAGTYNEAVTLKSGITLLGAGANEGAVVINGSMALPASLSNVEVGNLTVHNGSATSYLLDMRDTADLTDVVFHDVTFALVSDFLPTNSGGSHSNDAPIGISYARGSIALHDGADGDSAGLTFRDVTMASNDHAMGVANELAMLQIESAGGAKLVLDGLALTGMNPGTATLGAQFNVSGNGATDAIELVNSQTSGGGNFYVSGFESALIDGNVFDGQGLALNGAKHATVTDNTFQNIDDTITANGTQHRGLVIEDAWGTDGASDITVTGNTFNNITVSDGGIAFQRFTDGSPANTATIDRLSDVDIHGNTFTNLGAGVNPVYLNPDYFGPGAVLPATFHDGQLVIGTSGADVIIDASTGANAIFAGTGNDSITGGAGNDIIDGGSGTDTAVFSGAHTAYNTSGISAAGGVASGTISGLDGSDSLSGVEVLQFADGFHVLAGMSIQAAINAAHDGDTIFIAAGTFREQLTIDGKAVALQGAGAGQTIIESPDAASLVSNASDLNSGRPTKYAVVTVKGDADVTIAGVTVDGRDQASIPNPPTNYDFMAIYVLNSDAHIDGVTVTGADELAGADVSGIQRNHAILATSHDVAHGGTGAHTVEIENSTVSGFQKTGIFVNGSTLTANIHDNTIVGTHTANTAQNGIQVGSLFGAVGDGDFSGTHATIDHNTITDIGNSGPAGSASGIIVFSGDASTVSITNNTLTGWAAPQANGNSGITFVDSNGGAVTGNTISGFDAGLNVLDQFGGTLHTPVSHSGNIYNNDVVNIALEPNPAGTTGLTFSGSEGHDELTGNAGADTLSGLGGNDVIVGGSGVDTATYTATISTSGITDDGAGHFVVATGGSEGTDTLSGVEKIDGAGTHNILLVGNGGYATIQAAVNAATDGDTIEIAAGTYTENVTITGKALTIDGVENGSVNSVTLNGQITVAGTLNGAFALTDININATGKDYGVLVSANSTGFAGSVTLDDVSISNAKQDGFAYVRAGNGSIPTQADTIGAVSILNSQFHNNATASSPASGRADILLFGYNQDLTITNVVIDTPGAFAQKAIQMRGIEGGDVVNVGPYDQAGDVAINNLTITGAYGQDVIAFYRIAGFDSFTGANNSVNVTRSVNANSNATLEPWAVINMDEVGGSIDLSSFFSSASNLASANGGPGVPSWIATLQGLGGNEIFIGTSGTDTLVGRGGNDILNGGAGADTMQGGAGNDTYLVDNVGDVVAENASEGTDLVQSSVSFTLGANVDNLTLTGSGNINGTGNGDANVITGNSGNNTLDGGAGADTLTGGDGDDTYVVDNAGDVVTEAATVGAGTDAVQSSISYTLGANVENLTLTGSANINGTGNGDANVITGNTGSNILDGGVGADTMVGGLGNDTYVVDNAGDVVTEALNEGTDTVQSSISYTLGANVENLTLTGSANINGTGNGDANVITGNTGSNILDGGIGADTMAGGLGNDTYLVDNADDVVTEALNEGTDSVSSSVTYTLGANVENLTLTGSANINGTGNGLANIITGNAATTRSMAVRSRTP